MIAAGLLLVIGAVDTVRVLLRGRGARLAGGCAGLIGLVLAICLAAFLGVAPGWALAIALAGAGWVLAVPDVVVAGSGLGRAGRVALVALPAALASLLLFDASGERIARAAAEPGAPSVALARLFAERVVGPAAGLPLAALLTAVALVPVLIVTANLVIRAVMASLGGPGDPSPLRGGRIIGPAERLLIVVLAVAGAPELIVALIAAKGIVRFPEISRNRGQGAAAEAFLVGSLLSWGIAALGLALLAAQAAGPGA